GDLVLIGYTLGASIALQYGLDYPDEVRGLVLMTVAARPKTREAGAYEMRLRAAEDPKVYEEWLAVRAPRGGSEGLRRVAGVSAACHEVRGTRIARAIDGAAPPGGPTVPVPRPENDRCLRRTRSPRDAQAQAAPAAGCGLSPPSAR